VYAYDVCDIFGRAVVRIGLNYLSNITNMYQCVCEYVRAEMMKNPVDGFSVGLVDDKSIFEWQVMIEGPSGTL